MDATQTLTALLNEEEDRITRLWAKTLRAELNEVDLPGHDLRQPLQALVRELARLLYERGDEAVYLWPEVVRQHAIVRYEQHFEPEDLARELGVLERVLLRVYLRRARTVDPAVVERISEVVAEGVAAGQAAFARMLRTEEVRFREAAVMETVLNHVEVGILLADPKGAITFVTPPVSRLTGIAVRTWLGAHTVEGMRTVLAQMNATHEDGTPFRASEMPYIQAVRERREVRGVLMRIECLPEGHERLLELSATPISEDGADGELTGVVQTFTDRTEMARKQRELLGAHEELRRLQSRLLQRGRMQALGQLASGTAHALNNFLNVVKLRVTLLRKEVKPEHLDALERTVKSLGELVSRLQDFVVPQADEAMEDVRLDDVVREALELAGPELSPSPDGPQVKVEVALHADGEVHADEGLLRELLVNLLVSSRERLPGGGTVRVETSKDGDSLVVRVEDSGPPFTVEEMTRLFDPLKAKVKSDTPHLALLLAAGRTQVQRWGGELSCESCNSPVGSARILRLPLAQVTRQATPPPPTRPAPPLPPRRRVGGQPTRRVLVVDDDPENARMLAEVLVDEGYEIRVAHSAEAALRLWGFQRFDAALLDALMPDMSGWELARELRARSPQILLAMVTGADVRGQNRENLALVDAVFRKPIDVAALDEFLTRAGMSLRGDGPELHA